MLSINGNEWQKMEIDSGRLPVEGENFKFKVMGVGVTQIEVWLNGRLIHQHKCPDPPCHEMIYVPLGTGAPELIIIAQDSSGKTLERRFFIVKPSNPITLGA
jgi:hypothetical protein